MVIILVIDTKMGPLPSSHTGRYVIFPSLVREFYRTFVKKVGIYTYWFQLPMRDYRFNSLVTSLLHDKSPSVMVLSFRFSLD